VNARVIHSCVVGGLCAALVACGSSSPKTTRGATAAGSSGSTAKLKFSKCMRANGVPSFPDPSAGGAGPSGQSNSFDGIAIPATINLQSPAFQAAVRSCKPVLSGASPPPPITEAQKLAALANARCMRRHGVPNFPDPTFSGHAVVDDLGIIDTNSPAFKRAAAACGTP
jgi:hypothetical protein